MAGAEVNLNLPPKLKLGDHPCENWNQFKRYFKIYLRASGNDIDISQKTAEERMTINKRKARILLDTAGKEGIDLVSTFGLTEGAMDDYDTLMTAFDNYFTTNMSHVNERYQFNIYTQQVGETFEQFLKEAKRLLKLCGYGSQQNTILRDKILMGMRDTSVRDMLLKLKYLSLENTIRLCREAEQERPSRQTRITSTQIKKKCKTAAGKVSSKDESARCNRRKRSTTSTSIEDCRSSLLTKKKCVQTVNHNDCSVQNIKCPGQSGELEPVKSSCEIVLSCGSCFLKFPNHTSLKEHETACPSFRMPCGNSLTSDSPKQNINKSHYDPIFKQDLIEDGDFDPNDSAEEEKEEVVVESKKRSLGNKNEEEGRTAEAFDTGQICSIARVTSLGQTSFSGSSLSWGPCVGTQLPFEYTGREQVNLEEREFMKPMDMYLLFVTDHIIDEMVEEINSNADCYLCSQPVKRTNSLHLWEPTNREELKIYIGLRIWMGLVKMSRVVDYWSDCAVYQNGIAKKSMTKLRFQQIFRFWHFRKNYPEGKSHFHPLLGKLEQRFMQIKTPGEHLVLDEHIAPVHTDRIFEQYMPFRTEQPDKKQVRLCDPSGYTYRMMVFSGKGSMEPTNAQMATHVIMSMVEPFLDCGRILCLDSYFTSMGLIQRLLERKTHFLGTLDKNNQHFPSEVLNADLKKGQVVALENTSSGTTVLKWGDDQDVQLVSTKYSSELSPVGRRSRVGEETMKPVMVLEYNNIKGAVDTSDLLSSYECFHAPHVLWHHRVLDNALFYTCLVNAMLLWNETRPESTRRISLLQFSREVCQQLLNIPEDQLQRTTNPTTHYLGQAQEIQGTKTQRKARGRCRGCYKELIKTLDRKDALSKVKRVSTQCITCPDKPYLCMPCFKNIHEGVLNQS